MIVGIAEGAVLELVVTGAQPEDQPPVADLIDGIGHLGKQGRIAEPHAEHQGTEFHFARRGSESGQQRPALPRASTTILSQKPIKKVIDQPQRVEADILGQLRHHFEIRPASDAPLTHAVDLRQHEPDLLTSFDHCAPCVTLWI